MALTRPITSLLILTIRRFGTVQRTRILIRLIKIEPTQTARNITGIRPIGILHIRTILPAIRLRIIPVVPRLTRTRPRRIPISTRLANRRTINHTQTITNVEVEVVGADALAGVVLAGGVADVGAVDVDDVGGDAGDDGGVPGVAQDAFALDLAVGAVGVAQDGAVYPAFADQPVVVYFAEAGVVAVGLAIAV